MKTLKKYKLRDQNPYKPQKAEIPKPSGFKPVNIIWHTLGDRATNVDGQYLLLGLGVFSFVAVNADWVHSKTILEVPAIGNTRSSNSRMMLPELCCSCVVQHQEFIAYEPGHQLVRCNDWHCSRHNIVPGFVSQSNLHVVQVGHLEGSANAAMTV